MSTLYIVEIFPNQLYLNTHFVWKHVTIWVLISNMNIRKAKFQAQISREINRMTCFWILLTNPVFSCCPSKLTAWSLMHCLVTRPWMCWQEPSICPVSATWTSPAALCPSTPGSSPYTTPITRRLSCWAPLNNIMWNLYFLFELYSQNVITLYFEYSSLIVQLGPSPKLKL